MSLNKFPSAPTDDTGVWSVPAQLFQRFLRQVRSTCDLELECGIELVNQFSLDIKKGDAKNSSNKQPFTLRHHLEDQKEILHGYEARALRYIPKVCEEIKRYRMDIL